MGLDARASLRWHGIRRFEIRTAIKFAKQKAHNGSRRCRPRNAREEKHTTLTRPDRFANAAILARVYFSAFLLFVSSRCYRNRMGATSLAAPAGARPLGRVGYCRAASLSPQLLCFVFVSLRLSRLTPAILVFLS